MRYFKIVEDDYIVAVGIGSETGIEISVFDYNRAVSMFGSKPSAYGYEYKLTQDYRWEAIELDRNSLSDDEIRQIFASDILSSIEVSTKPDSDKEGFILEQVYDPECHSIIWRYIEDPAYAKSQAGTYIDPITYTEGMSVETGKWYTDGDDIWDAIQDGTPSGFDDTEYFNIITV